MSLEKCHITHEKMSHSPKIWRVLMSGYAREMHEGFADGEEEVHISVKEWN